MDVKQIGFMHYSTEAFMECEPVSFSTVEELADKLKDVISKPDCEYISVQSKDDADIEIVLLDLSGEIQTPDGGPLFEAWKIAHPTRYHT